MFVDPGLRASFDRLAARSAWSAGAATAMATHSWRTAASICMVDSLLMPYDIIPMIPIIEGACGDVTDLNGERRCRAAR